MTHHLSAIVGERTLIERASERFGVAVTPLEQGFALLRVHNVRPAAGDAEETPGFHRLHHFVGVLAELSMQGPMAYVETEYWGGVGDQAAAVYRDGALVYAKGIVDLDDPRHGGIGNINGALELLGVVSGDAIDELEAVGLRGVRG